eukprot:TRINITY_DN3840_c0_g4_i2.p1 TRINITY_DN3840_c0_g4~~TRINITY_DN3840_c0_g4_i2.p1  ORF type:complete len:230 (+),score=41.99 TRINITY_DN3840_c0_g4_i2:158-847(+)
MLSASLYGKEVSNDDTLVSSYDNEDDRSPIERRTSHSIHLARNHLVCNIVLQLLIFAAMLFFALAENWCTLKKNSIVGLLFLHYKGENYLLYHYRSEDLCTDQFPIGIEECKRVIWFALAGFAAIPLIVTGLVLNLYSILHLTNTICANRIRLLRRSEVMVLMSLCYVGAVAVWGVVSTAVTRIRDVRVCFYGAALTSLIAFISTWCYYKALANIKKERLVSKLINFDD